MGQRSLRGLRAAYVPLALIAIVVAFVLIAIGIGGDVLRSRSIEMLINLVLVLGLYTYAGNSGAFSFGHVSFMAIAAYVYALLTIPVTQKEWLFPDMPGVLSWILDVELGALPATLIAAAVAGMFALLLAPALVRLSGAQISIASLAVLVIVEVVLSQADPITRGASSIVSVPPTTTLGVALATAAIVIVLAYAFQESRRGLRLRASRENLAAARSIGIGISGERTVAWVLSACVMGVGGALYAAYIPTFGPDSFYIALTFLTVAMLVIGGMTSITGAVVGVLFVSFVSELLRRIEINGLGPIDPGGVPGLTELILALILLGALILRPNGLTGGRELPPPSAWRRRRRPATTDEAPAPRDPSVPSTTVALKGKRA